MSSGGGNISPFSPHFLVPRGTVHIPSVQSVEEVTRNIVPRALQYAEWSQLFTTAVSKEEVKQCLETRAVLKEEMKNVTEMHAVAGNPFLETSCLRLLDAVSLFQETT